MNTTALLSRMFDRWYRRQIARQHLLGQVRLVGRRIEPGPRRGTDRKDPPGAGRRRPA